MPEADPTQAEIEQQKVGQARACPTFCTFSKLFLIYLTNFHSFM